MFSFLIQKKGWQRCNCHVRDSGLGAYSVPQWHTLTFEGQVRVDMRYVCPKDAKEMLVKQARSAYWKKWAANSAAEEDEGRVDCKGSKRCQKITCGRRLGAEQTLDIGWSDESEGQACHKEEGTEKHRFHHCQVEMKSGAKSQRLSEIGSK